MTPKEMDRKMAQMIAEDRQSLAFNHHFLQTMGLLSPTRRSNIYKSAVAKAVNQEDAERIQAACKFLEGSTRESNRWVEVFE